MSSELFIDFNTYFDNAGTTTTYDVFQIWEVSSAGAFTLKSGYMFERTAGVDYVSQS